LVEMRPQLVSDDLADGVAGQLVEKGDLPRHLVAGQVRPDMCFEQLGYGRRAWPKHYERGEPLPEALVVDAPVARYRSTSSIVAAASPWPPPPPGARRAPFGVPVVPEVNRTTSPLRSRRAGR
jgi:hypothetical protein